MKQWQVRQQVLAEMRNEMDTFRMVETEDALDDAMELLEKNLESDGFWNKLWLILLVTSQSAFDLQVVLEVFFIR